MVRIHDLNKSLHFYCDILGLQEIKRTENRENCFTLIYLSASDDIEKTKYEMAPTIELTYNWNPEIYNEGRNFGHLAFEVVNIYETCHHLREHGVKINRPPRDGYMAFIRSPDNISIEFLQKGEPLAPKEPWISMPNRGHW